MRKNFVLLPFLFLCFVLQCEAQTFENRPITSETRVRDLGDISKAKDSYKISIINGQEVIGTPFIFYKWLNGTVATKDGRVFIDYELMYDAYNQSLFIKNAKDSLEVQDEIASFTLIDSSNIYKFVNANQFKSGKKNLYYQELIDDDLGTLYKENKKKVSDELFGLPSGQVRKYFRDEQNYFYYNKKTKKLHHIVLSNPNIPKILDLNQSQQKAMDLKSYNFSIEEELIKFFKAYFEQSKNV